MDVTMHNIEHGKTNEVYLHQCLMKIPVKSNSMCNSASSLEEFKTLSHIFKCYYVISVRYTVCSISYEYFESLIKILYVCKNK